MKCVLCSLDESKVIYRGEFWTVVFHKQDYLGRCVLVSNRHVDDFVHLTNKELIDFKRTLKAVERYLKDYYNCTMLNWCCNMNNSVESPHVHIHVRPRYKNKVEVNGKTYIDKEFGAHYDRKAPIQFDEETIKYIYDSFSKNLQKYYLGE